MDNLDGTLYPGVDPLDPEPESESGGFPEEALTIDGAWDEDQPIPVAEPKKPRKLLTRQRAKEARAQRDRGFSFLLQYTLDDEGEPMEARVRRVNIMDAAVLGSMPKTVQSKLIEIQAENARRQANAQAKRNGTKAKEPEINASSVVRELGRSREMANAYCLAGFMEPRVYLTEADADRYDGVWVEDIDITDRMIFLGVCEGSLADAAGILTPFLEQRPSDVEVGQTLSPLSGEDAFSTDSFEEATPIPRLVAVE